MLLTTWAVFKSTLGLVITEARMESGLMTVATLLSERFGVGLVYAEVVTLLALGVACVAAFVWGYVFHKSSFSSH
ncbi:MAG: hypothetical protein ABEJ79_05745 [Halolamina sp.]